MAPEQILAEITRGFSLPVPAECGNLYYNITNITMENHHFSWENPLFLWPFSIAMLNYQRVYIVIYSLIHDIILYIISFHCVYYYKIVYIILYNII